MQRAKEFYDYPLTLTNLIKWGVDTFPEQEVVYAPPDAPKLRRCNNRLSNQWFLECLLCGG